MNAGGADSSLHESSICAVVVTYQPDHLFADRISRILRQVGAVVIVDNGSNAVATRLLRELAADLKITLHVNLENLGVASALNIGIRHAIALGCTWVLLLDQDSIVAENMVEELLAAREAYPHREKLAVIGSGFSDINRKTPVESGSAALWEEVNEVITSGSLIPLSVHAIVGPFRDEFFIDCVDIEYCLRARAKGFLIIKTRKLLMLHAIGIYTQHRWLWRKRWTTNHPSERRYYIARNGTLLLREYGTYPLGLWRLKSFLRCIQVCKRIALHEESKTVKIIAVAQGWWDGITGNMQRKNGRRRPR